MRLCSSYQISAPVGVCCVCFHLVFLQDTQVSLLHIKMAGIAAVPHKQCGLYTVAAPMSDKQVVVNPLACQEVSVTRSEKMLDSDLYYWLDYDDDGNACLAAVGEDNIPVKSLKFTMRAVQNAGGRIAIQDTVGKTVVWADSLEHLRSRKTVTLKLSESSQLVSSSFASERFILRTGIGQPHTLGGKVFWEFRRLKELLNIDYGDDAIHNTWVMRNFHRTFSQWETAYTDSGGHVPESHWITSQRSWDSTQEARLKAKTIDKCDAGVQFQDHMEHYHCSTQAVVYSFLHWMSSLGSPGAKASAHIALDNSIEKTLPKHKWIMLLDDVCPAGTIPTHGVKVTCQSGYITDASGLAEHFPLIKKALNNKNRRELVEPEQPAGAVHVCA